MSKHGIQTGPQGEPSDGQPRQVALRLDERKLRTRYADSFQVTGTPEEAVLDFGMNEVIPTPDGAGEPAIFFHVASRVTVSYYTAKRMAVALGQLIRQHEDQFGQLRLDRPEHQR